MSWNTIESDPGVFTDLVADLGVQDIQVEELYSLDSESLDSLGCIAPPSSHSPSPSHIHGLLFLFKWRPDHRDERPVLSLDEQREHSIFFASQVINNACATQALISILLNANSIDIGPHLTAFRDFAQTFPPSLKGLALSNSDLIRNAHNSFSRPDFFTGEEASSSQPDAEVFHFISYLPINGHLFELDGLRDGPIDLGPCEDAWLESVKEVIHRRIEGYARNEIRFNLMAVIENPLLQLQQQMSELVESGAGGESEAAVGLKRRIQAEEEKRALWKAANTRRKHNYLPFLVNYLRVLHEKGVLDELVDDKRPRKK